MMRLFCKSKIQGLVVTKTDINYQGSITIDSALAEKADVQPYEMVQVLNLANGERIETYYIPGKPNQGEVCLNGAAARWFQVGDRIIVLSTALFSEGEKRSAKPLVVITNERNKEIKKKR
jgi:aspartate 1-decarboxylase